MAKKTMKAADWSNKLQGLLDKAVAATSSGNTNKIVAVQEELQDFIDVSPDYADSLDRVARGAIIDLAVSGTQAALDRLQKRQEELDRLKKLIAGVVEQFSTKKSEK